MAEELRPEEPFGLQGQYENIWHIAAAERWSDGRIIGHRTFCGRNYPEAVDRSDLEGSLLPYALRVASWAAVEEEVSELAALARRYLDAHVHKVIATLRADGSPRVSGTEVIFADGHLWLGSMWQATKALDLRRDPRFALHSGSDDPPDWTGDAKIVGRAEETGGETKARVLGSQAETAHLFRADITEVSVVRLAESGDHLVIESWHEGRGYARRERR